jgi:hypothetical protein
MIASQAPIVSAFDFRFAVSRLHGNGNRGLHSFNVIRAFRGNGGGKKRLFYRKVADLQAQKRLSNENALDYYLPYIVCFLD